MNKYVLWLASWYPSKIHAFDGDFIERHAKAVCPFIPIVILFVTKDESLQPGETIIEKTEDGGMEVYRGYYGPSHFRLTEKIFSFFKYFFLQKKIFSQIKKQKGLPNLIHVHVAFKAGLFARYLKKNYHIPYIISEHWTGYYLENPYSIYKSDYLTLQLTKWILKGASLLLPVAQKLGETINFLTKVNFKVVPNVVDTDLFYFKPTKKEKTRFIHPSTMSYEKNSEGIIRAAIELNREGFEFELLMIGGITDSMLKLAKDSGGLDKFIFFKNEIPYKQVAFEMQNSSALVLFSRFENLPCVILEALCCGLPIISTGVGGIQEIVSSSNGILVESENEDQLMQAMKSMILNYSHFDQQKIAKESALLFGYSTVGEQIFNWYQNVLKNKVGKNN